MGTKRFSNYSRIISIIYKWQGSGKPRPASNGMNVNKVGLAVGAFAGLWHIVWSLLILLGWAQGFLDFVTMVHSLNNPYIVHSFNPGLSIVLIVLTSFVGYIVGSVFATIFNKLHK